MASPGIEPTARGSGFLPELRRLAAATPYAVALLEPGGEALTFAGLQDRISAVAHTVIRAGIGGRDVVALVLPDGAGLIANFLGVASVAGCAVLNPALRRPEMELLLDQLDARAVVLDPSLASPVEEAALARGIDVLDVASESGNVRHPGPELPPRDQVALLLQTSATTGKARIVPLTHLNLASMATYTCGALQLTSNDRMLSMMPMFHLQGLLSSLSQLLAGGGVIRTSGFDTEEFLGWLEDYRPTWYTAGPTLHHAILPLLEARPDVLERAPLRFVRSIGAALPEALLEKLERTLRAPVLEGYGATEAGAVTSNVPYRRKPGSAGRSIGPEVGILDESGHLLPADSEGEIVVRGPAVMRAYHNDPEANRSAFHDGWFRTGDLGRVDEEGFLFVTGRIKEIINRGGEKILPGDIEAALIAHPAVAEAVAFGVPHPTLGEDVMAAVVLRPGASASEAELSRFASARIAEFKLPRRIVFVDAIPKGATGKPSRVALAEQWKSELDATPAASAAATEVEQRLAAIWREILKIETVETRDDFFQLGGDSLALQLMLLEVEQEFVIQDEPAFLSQPTVETLARVVTHSPEKRAENSPIVPLQVTGPRIPFFCFPGAGENPYYFLELARSLGQDQPFFVVRDERPLQDRGAYTLEEQAARLATAIRSMRAEGPYLLGGHCFGGILAFEVARQLVAGGLEVSLLVLFEAPTPGYPKVVRHWKKYVRHSSVFVGSVLRGRNSIGWTEVRAHAVVVRQLFRQRTHAFARRLLLSAGVRNKSQLGEGIAERNERTARAYLPGKLACNVVHFIAADECHSALILDDPRLGWRDKIAGRFSVREVPGIGDAIFKGPNVNELAPQLREQLDLAPVRAKSTAA